MAANPPSGNVPASSIFVGNINFDLSEQDVIEYFTQVGPVKSARIVTDREAGKPRGFGFVEFYDIPTAESAVRNLNGSDMGGRTIRVTFAEDAPGSTSHQQRPGSTAPPGAGGGGHHPSSFPGGGARDLNSHHKNRMMIVGNDLAYHSHRGMASLLGAAASSSQDPTAAAALMDATTAMLARRTRSEIYNYLADMKEYATANPTEARQLLTTNPQLTKALFQMEVIVGMVRNPLGNVAPKGVASSVGGGGGGGGGGGLGRSSSSMNRYEQQQQQQGNGSQQGLSGGGGGGGGGGPVDPRRGGAVPPRPMVSSVQQQQQQREKASSLMPGMSPEQQEALLQQVMSLTAEQIELLPAEQKAQVVALQNLQRGGGGG